MKALQEPAVARKGEPVHRHILFLQGPASPFFSRLGEALEARGHRIDKINLNFGDQFFWRGRATAYRGRFSRWQAYLERRLDRDAITDLILFGDCRPYHRAAVELAQARGIAIHVFEEGYLRPDWVTMEKGGVNGFSSLPTTASEVQRLSAELLEPDPAVKAGPSLRNRVVWDILYNLSCMFGRVAYPFYRHHRPWPVMLEYTSWMRRLVLMRLEKKRGRAALARLATSEPGFFLFPLQLDSDFQIRVHSDLRSMEEALRVVIPSFAAHAPATDHLVVKGHPLDNGLVNRRRQCQAIARAAGIEDRVIFIEGGSLARLSRDAKGLVTVNSTSGMVALEQQRPVAVLGRAIYHIDGLTHQGSLDDFWEQPKRPDPDLLAHFIRLLKARALVNGSFFTEEGLRSAVAAAVGRLEAARPRRLELPQAQAEVRPRVAAKVDVVPAE